MTKPDYTDVVYVPPTVSEIWPGVYQGGRPDTYEGYDLVVCCEKYERKTLTRPFQGKFVHIPMEDDDDFLIPEEDIKGACEYMEVVFQEEGKILVHCTGGLNRSALVMGKWLRRRGLVPMETVVLMRALRSRHVLCNRHFERWVLGETLPTAETSAFRLIE